MRSPLRVSIILCVFVALIGLHCLAAAATESAVPARNSVTQLKFSYGGTTYDYLVYTPAKYDAKQVFPVLLLLHGAHGKGADMLGLWRTFADEHSIVVVAPTFPLTAEFEEQVPKLLPELIDTVGRTWKLNAQRRYIFGYSAGGYSTFTAATRTSNYFAGAGVFACIITPDYEHIVGEAKGKTPIAIYIGDHDQAFRLWQTRRTRDLLEQHGFPVHYVELQNQDHNYGAASVKVNADAWNFLSQYSLTK